MFEQLRLTREIQVRSAIPSEAGPLRLSTIGVIGAGHTGRRIASSCLALARVLLVEPDADAREAAARHIRRVQRDAVSAGSLSRREMFRRLRRLEVLPAWPHAQSTELVIECVPEDLALKHQVLACVEPHLSPDSVWATNTSALRIAEIAGGARCPQRVLGMHHLIPGEQLRLVELVATPATDAAALATAQLCAVARGIAVLYARDAPGFFTTRVLSAYFGEALLLLQEGWSVTAVDDAAERFGFLAGPFMLLDRIGLDIAGRVAERLKGRDDHERASAPLIRLLEARCLGRKSGSGFYRYDRGHSITDVNPLMRMYEAPATGRSVREIRERLALAVVNEAARAVHKRIVATPSDADVGTVLGVGFPAETGGPLRYAARRPGIVARLQALADACGPRFRPVPLLGALTAPV